MNNVLNIIIEKYDFVNFQIKNNFIILLCTISSQGLQNHKRAIVESGCMTFLFDGFYVNEPEIIVFAVKSVYLLFQVYKNQSHNPCIDIFQQNPISQEIYTIVENTSDPQIKNIYELLIADFLSLHDVD